MDVPVTPIPVVNGVKLSGDRDFHMLELWGEDFTADLKVWFSDVEADTMYREEASLMVVVPELSRLEGAQVRSGALSVPLFLVRVDGPQV